MPYQNTLAISDFVKKTIEEQLQVPSEKIIVLHNGVPVSKFRVERKEFGEDVRIIYVGRVEYIKGIHTIISAIHEVKEQFPLKFFVVGDGSYRPTLEKMVEHYQLQDYVRFCGATLDVPRYLSDADIFIHVPVCEEGFGITVVEAMAAGCVCVCGAKGGIPEIIHDGIDGFLVPTDTNESLVKVLKEVIPLCQENRCGDLRSAAIARAKDFDIEKYAERLDAILEDIEK